MSHRKPVEIGPRVKINGMNCHWVDGRLLTDSFNTLADIEEEYNVITRKRTYTLIAYEYHGGYRYHHTRQVLPMAESMATAQRMAIPILALMKERRND